MAREPLSLEEKRAIKISLSANEILLLCEALGMLSDDYGDKHPEQYTINTLVKRILKSRNKYLGGDV